MKRLSNFVFRSFSLVLSGFLWVIMILVLISDWFNLSIVEQVFLEAIILIDFGCFCVLAVLPEPED